MYIAFLDEMAEMSVWSLNQAQSAAGRIQHACLTFPPGANCMLKSLYAFMRGLTLPWQKRKVLASTRADV